MNEQKRCVVQFFDLKALLPEGLELASMTVDHDFEPVLVFQSEREPPLTPQPILHVLRGWPPRPVARVVNPGASFPIVQPLNDGWLLLDRRTKPGRANGWLTSSDGGVRSQAHFGDGIADLQTDTSGEVWVSRFDEGIYSSHQEALCYGLSRFRTDGTLVWNMPWKPEEFSISDCYALNVVSANEVWTSYYTEFPLVRITNDQPRVVMASPVPGADALAVAEELVLFAPGYEGSELTVVDTSAAQALTKLHLLDREGVEVGPRPHVRARGNRMYFLEERGLAGVEFNQTAPFVTSVAL